MEGLPSQASQRTVMPLSNAFDPMLEGRRILVVEDQALIALDLQTTLEDRGATVLGPFARLGAALRAASDRSVIDAAILDVELGVEDTLPLADRLAERGVPFVFHTGHAGTDRLRMRYEGVPIILKPALPGEVVRRLASALPSLGARF